MTARAVVLTWVQGFAQDADGVLSTTHLDDALDAALAEFSTRRAAVGVKDYAGTGTTCVWTLPSDWVADWSQIVSLFEVSSAGPACPVDRTQYSVEQTETLTRLRLTYAVCSGSTLRLRYTRTHTIDASLSTVPLPYEQAVAMLAGAYAAAMLAARAATQGDTTLGADTVDHQSRTDRYLRMEKTLRDASLRLLPVQRNRFLHLMRA
jgi:hypothetical protein